MPDELYGLNNRGKFENFVRRINPTIDNILGNMGDIKAKKSVVEALKGLQTYKTELNDYKKFLAYSDKLSNTTLSNEDYYKTTNDYEFKTDVINNSQTFTDYKNSLTEEYINSLPKDENGNPQINDDFKKYLNSNPDKYNELKTIGGVVPKTEARNEEEINQRHYELAGFKPEEMAWYNTYKTEGQDKIKDFNQRLARYIYSQAPSLTSPGQLGNKLYDTFSSIAGTYAMPETKPVDNPLKKSNPKNWEAEQIDGKWMWTDWVYNEKKGWQKQTMGAMSEKEVKKYSATNDKEYTAQEVEKMTIDDVSALPTGTINKIWDYLTPEVKEQWYQKHPEDRPKEGTTSKKKSSNKGSKTTYYLHDKATDHKLQQLSDLAKVTEKGKAWDDWKKTSQDTYTAIANSLKGGKNFESISKIQKRVGEYEDWKSSGKLTDEQINEENLDNLSDEEIINNVINIYGSPEDATQFFATEVFKDFQDVSKFKDIPDDTKHLMQTSKKVKVKK